MGMPSVTIGFTEVAKTVIQRGNRGTIAMIVRDTVPDTNPIIYLPGDALPNVLSAANRKQVELASIGYVNKPKKIISYVIANESEDYKEAFNGLDTEKFDYLVCPSVETDEQTKEVADWTIQKNQEGETFIAILPNHEANSECIINFTNEAIMTGEKTYSTEEYCSRIAGILAGAPLTMSCTYAELPEVKNCDRYTRREMDAFVDAGHLFMFFDGEKVKLARAVNSLTKETAEKGNKFRKIKIVDTINMIKNDIRRTAEDNYLGKYANTYDNKCLLISAISNYLTQLVKDGILDNQLVEIDIEANKAYLAGIGVKIAEMTDEEIKVADTGSNVFVKAVINIPDAIEDITIQFTI